jgi:hypothetical protein
MKPIEVEIDNFGDGFVATISTEGTDFLFVGDDGNAAETPEAARLSPEWAAAQRIAEADRIVRALATEDPIVKFDNQKWHGCALCWETEPPKGHAPSCPWVAARAYVDGAK